MSVKNVKLVIEYDGTHYHGWQPQDNAVSVQRTIEQAVDGIVPDEKCKLTGCSRTDFGVHAFGQVANFHTGSSIPPEKFAPALNRVLPEDIAIVSSEQVPDDFHARFDATGKKYRYQIYNSKFRSALLRHRACHVSGELDAEKMNRAASFLVGRHDFSAFQATGSTARNPVRTIWTCSVTRDERIVTIDISGDGFLYNMVRIIAGTLIDIGKGKVDADSMPAIIASQERKSAGRTAPSQGLYLVEIYYE